MASLSDDEDAEIIRALKLTSKYHLNIDSPYSEWMIDRIF